jgi:hypothetical protein
MFWLEALDGGKCLMDVGAEELEAGEMPVAVFRPIPPGEALRLYSEQELLQIEGQRGRLYSLVKASLGAEWPIYREVSA